MAIVRSFAISLYTDASHLGIGGVLMQEQDGHFKIIRYLSRTLNPAERRYSASERECLAIVHELAIVKPCILGTNFTSMTDCRALTTMGEKTNCNFRIMRCLLLLLQFTFGIKYVKGSENLSQAPERMENESTS